MDARFYNSEDIDIERLANDLVGAYQVQGYQAQQIGNKDQILVQLKKGGDFEAIIGMQAALSLTIQRTTGGVLAMVGQQRWLDKAAVGAVGIVALPVLWPLALTAGVGALRQASLSNQVLNMVDGLVRQQRPGIQAGPIPYQLMQQVQPQLPPPAPTYMPSTPTYTPSTPVYVPPAVPAPPVPQAIPAPPVQKGLRCTNCNTPYEPGDTFCTGCGHSLTPPRLYCANCNSELKQGASFCPKCGASTFTTVSAQQAAPRPAPVQPAPRVTYTPAPTPPPVSTPPPPRPQTPVYTPPAYAAPTVPVPPAPTPPTQATPPRQPEVYYTPPVTQEPAVQPQPTVNYVQSTPTPPPAPPKQPEVYYTPPETQEPAVQPQPTITYTASSAPKQDVTQHMPPRPEKVYYTPSSQAQSASPAQSAKPTVQSPAQQPPDPKPITSHSAPQPAVDAGVEWGTLTFNDGTQVQLKGDGVSVGRYDHDLGGIQPDVDLAKMEGADTVSRIHAAIEHSGNAYTLTDLNSTNTTRINGKRLEPDTPTSIDNDDTLSFGKVTCIFKKL